MRKISLLAVAGLALTLLARAQEPGPRQEPPVRLTTGLAGEFTPLAEPAIASRPVPRLHDGRPDISGPWVGGGSNDDIER